MGGQNSAPHSPPQESATSDRAVGCHGTQTFSITARLAMKSRGITYELSGRRPYADAVVDSPEVSKTYMLHREYKSHSATVDAIAAAAAPGRSMCTGLIAVVRTCRGLGLGYRGSGDIRLIFCFHIYASLGPFSLTKIRRLRRAQISPQISPQRSAAMLSKAG